MLVKYDWSGDRRWRGHVSYTATNFKEKFGHSTSRNALPSDVLEGPRAGA
jgi:hypothetical protein